MMKLMKMCKEGLGKFPNTLEEDLELLKKESLTYNERNCIIYRAGEKRVYSFLMRLATDTVEVLKGKLKVPDSDSKTKAYYASIQHLLAN